MVNSTDEKGCTPLVVFLGVLAASGVILLWEAGKWAFHALMHR